MRTYVVSFFASAGVFSAFAFLPNYARDVAGADDFAVGIIVSTYFAFFFVSSFLMGRWADLRGRRRILQAGLVLSAVAVLTHLLARDPLLLMMSRAFFGLSFGMFPAAMIVYAREAKVEVGRFVSYGSLGWGAGALLGGIVNEFEWIFLVSSAMFLVAFLVAFTLPAVQETRLQVPLFPAAMIRRNLPIYTTMLIRHTGANMIWAFFPLYLTTQLGLSFLLIGVIHAINTTVQFATMQGTTRLSSTRLIFLGLGFSTATFFAMALARNFLEMALTQVTLGLAWGCIYVGALKFVIERNEEKTTSTALLQSTIALSSILGPILGGTLVALTGNYVITMYAAGFLTLLDFAVFTYGLRAANRNTVPTGPSPGSSS